MSATQVQQPTGLKAQIETEYEPVDDDAFVEEDEVVLHSNSSSCYSTNPGDHCGTPPFH